MRGDGPADAGGAGRRAVAAVPRAVPDPGRVRRRARRRGRPRRGAGSATTAAPSTCTAAPRPVVDRHGGRSPLTSTRSSPCPASARTRPAPCSPSPSSATTASSTPTPPASWPAGRSPRCAPTEAQAAADAAVPAGRRLGVEPGDARPRRHRVHAAGARAAARARSRRACRVGAGRAGPSPIRPTAPPACRGGQSRFEGSDRQGRGRLVEALRRGPVAPPTLAAVMGWPDDPSARAPGRPPRSSPTASSRADEPRRPRYELS